MPIVVVVRAVWFILVSVSLIRWFKAHRRLAYGARVQCWETNYSLRTCLGKIPEGNGISSVTDVRVIPPWLGLASLFVWVITYDLSGMGDPTSSKLPPA